MKLQGNETNNNFSHQLVAFAGVTSVQLRKELTPTRYYVSPVHGYDIKQLMDSISEIIEAPQMQNVMLVGSDHLGRVALDYFQGWRPKLQIIAAFDTDPGEIKRAICCCRF